MRCAVVGWSPGKGGVMAPRDAGKLSFSFALEAGAGNPALALLRAQSLRSFDVRPGPAQERHNLSLQSTPVLIRMCKPRRRQYAMDTLDADMNQSVSGQQAARLLRGRRRTWEVR